MQTSQRFDRTAYIAALTALRLVLIVVAGLSAFLLRFEFTVPAAMKLCIPWGLATWSVAKTFSFHLFGLERGVWRYFSMSDLVRIAAANLVGSSVASAVLVTFCPAYFPRSVLIIDFVIALVLTIGVRTATRMFFEFASRGARTNGQRTLIYGAGDAGVLLLREARTNRAFGRLICGFVDDCRPPGVSIQGVRVLGAGPDLGRLVKLHNIARVLIAIPSGTCEQMSRIVGYCQAAGVNYQTMPAMSEVMSGRGLGAQIRDVAVEDVLGRGSVHLNSSLISAKVEGKVALVTGAGGSIGSELCRQIARFRPAAVVAFELSETALFHLEYEMRRTFPKLVFRPEIGNIQNVRRLREVFAQHSPALIFHAAAYKHVPLMESHFFEAVENNVFGTYNLAAVAGQYGVEDFVMISSDKAVHPANIMGTTKRVAELLIRSFQNGGPRYVSVRFGNVLGSNGSVVPLFKKQIAAGGPVTVTHPDMRRYFMTIPEAAQLVLQACSLGHGGEIFVLDMGQPVRIVDLAQQLIRLSGLRPELDIRIEFTGMRPGEKLYEELNLADEDMLPTHHEKIRIFSGSSLPWEEMSSSLDRLRSACERRDVRSLLTELMHIVPDYTASEEVLQCAFRNDLINLDRALRPQSAPVVVSC
jgi:FlaA1/EpsC-like NDP-sugar epimerase